MTLVKGVPEARSGTDSDCFESVRAPSSRTAVGAATSDTAQYQQQRQHAFEANQGTRPSCMSLKAFSARRKVQEVQETVLCINLSRKRPLLHQNQSLMPNLNL